MTKSKKTVDRISYTNKATIPASAPYSNLSPCYTLTREVSDLPDLEASRAVFDEIKAIVDSYIMEDYKNLKGYGKDNSEAVDAEKLGHRFTDGFPHVTNILTPDKPDHIPNLEDHGKLGTAYDEAMKSLMKLGKYTKYEDKLAFDYDFTAMMQQSIKQLNDMKIEMVADSLTCRNENHKFCGELDAIVSFMGGKWILDFKKTKKITKDLREKYLKQIAAYASCQEGVEGGIIFTPYEVIVEGHLMPYWEGFLVDRGAYKQRFGK